MVAPWYKEAATALKSEGILFGAMNMDVHGERGNSYGVQGICLHVCVCVRICVYVYFFFLDSSRVVSRLQSVAHGVSLSCELLIFLISVVESVLKIRA